MKSIFIFLLLALCITTYNCTLTDNGISLIEFNLSQEVVNVSMPTLQSVTIQFVIEGLNITGGAFNFNSSGFHKDKVYITWSDWNLSPSSAGENTINVTMCIPLTNIFNCKIAPPVHEEICEFKMIVYHGKDQKSYFPSYNITDTFANSTLSVVQNRRLPVLTDFSITVHPLAPLVTFNLAMEQYGMAFRALILYYTNGTDSSENLLGFHINAPISTTNGLYYIEGLLEPEVYGYDYTLYSLSIVDWDGNDKTYYTKEFESLFNVSTFTLPKSTTPTLSKLFTSVEPKEPTFNGENYSLYTADIYLNDYTLPINNFNADVGPCRTFYQNSTWIKLYCTVAPYRQTSSRKIQFGSINSYLTQNYFNGVFEYQNKNTQKPQILDISYSVPLIDQFEPFYLEVNYTFVSYEAYPWQLNLILPNVDIFQFSSNNLISGTIFNGTLNAFIYVDSYLDSFSKYNMAFEDSKTLLYEKKNVVGPKTIPRVVSTATTFDVQFGPTVVDSISGAVTLSYIIHSVAEDVSGQLTSSNVINLMLDQVVPSGYTNFFDINGGVISNYVAENGTIETFYQSYAIFSNSYNYLLPGDMLLLFNFAYSAYAEQSIMYNKQCYNYAPPAFQPTMVVEFSSSVPNPVNSLENQYVEYNLQFKGAPVSSAAIIFYQTNNIIDSLEYTSSPSFTCQLIEEYDFDSLLSQFQCQIPIAGLPSQVIVFHIDINIQGVHNVIYNSQLQENGYPSSIVIAGPQDTGLVPNITNFSTLFSTSSNTITIDYVVESVPSIPLSDINFVVFNRPIISNFQNFTQLNEITLTTVYSSFVGTFQIHLCELVPLGLGYSWQILGIYISIPSPFEGVNYEFPYEYLTALDVNSQTYNFTLGVCDFTGPRLVDLGILNPQDTYDTSNTDYDLQFYFDITDDISGFSSLSAYIQGPDYFNQEIILLNSTAQSGNNNNGRFIIDFNLPQYSSGTYSIQVRYLQDVVGNKRPFTPQNIAILAINNTFTAVSSKSVPNIPVLIGVETTYSFPYNNFSVSIEGVASQVIIIPNTSGFYNTTISLPQLNSSTFQLNDFSTQISGYSGIYTFSVCLYSQSLSSYCFSWFDLENLGFSYTFVI